MGIDYDELPTCRPATAVAGRGLCSC